VTFFDVNFVHDADDTEALLGYLERFRGILDAAPAAV
jgi:hypothetical protein